MEYNNYEYEPYKEFIRKSVSGPNISSTPQEYVSKDKYDSVINKANKRIVALFVACCISVGVAVPSVIAASLPAIKDAHHKYQITDVQLDKDTQKFYEDVIYPSISREGNDQHVEYDYNSIEEKLHTYGDGDYDKNIYLAFSEAEYQKKFPKFGVEPFDINLVLASNTDYRASGFKGYLKDKNFYEDGADIDDDKAYKKAVDNYKDMWQARISIEDSIAIAEEKTNAKKDDLNEMFEEHNLSAESKSSTLGGK
ncbi:MAG: hypothetical protein IJI43_00210 [Bacilli bacterium]|nr:hypothetical protein [Bacilli bacterium]